jgi:hypothetical protein
MPDRLTRVWRFVRRPSSAPATAFRPAGGRSDRVGGRDDLRYCGASGWHMRAGCNDGAGGTICPLCSRRVGIARQATTPQGIEVIEAHCA